MERKMSLFKSLNIESNEVVPVLLLITQSVFLGIFYGAFDIGAHTLFLKTFPEDMIPKAYIVSGIVGIILTATFSKLQSKISFSNLAIYSLLFIGIITFLMRLSFFFTDAPWTIMIVFILFGPLNIIGILAFWGTVGRIFNLRQGKRLYGIIDAGQIFGIILSSYIIPLILVYLNGTNNLLIISAFSAIIAMGVEIIITRKYPIDQETTEGNDEVEEEHEQLKLKEFLKQPYILYMALFVAFSMFAAFFVQYSFLVVTNEKYPVEEDMAKFLGFFTGTMMVFTFVIKTFVYSKLMKTYGLKVSLILSSILLALFTAIAIGSGFITGYEAHSAGFIYFFLFITLGKLFNKTLKDALELPSFKLLYQALNKKIRYDVQAKIDGTVNEIAALISGVLLSILSILTFIKLIHFSIVLFVLLGLWALITLRLYKEYRNSLEKALNADESNDGEDNAKLISQLGIDKKINDQELKDRILNISAYLPYDYHKIVNEINKELNYNIPIGNIEFFTDSYLELLKRKDEIDMPAGYDHKTKEFTLKELTLAFNSLDRQSRIEAIDYIGRLSENNRFTIISALLRTPSVHTQRVAIRLCGFHDEIDACPTLVEFIDSDDLRAEAIAAIDSIAPNGFKQLIQVFFRSDISLNAQLVIVDVLGKVNKPEVINFLLDNLSKHNTKLINMSIQSLIRLNYQADENVLSRLFPPITQLASHIAWDISVLSSIHQLPNAKLLEETMNMELKWHQKMLFDFLKVCYNAKSVEHVQNYIESDSAEGIGYGLELFDMFLSEEIKPIILLLFDDMSLEDKTRQLENFFAIATTSYNNVILNIINRDPNFISKRTKKIALSIYTEIFNEVIEDVIAHLFSSVEELQLLAAKSIIKMDQNKFKQVIQRVNVKNKKTLELNLKVDKEVTLSSMELDGLKEMFLKQLVANQVYYNQMFDWVEYDLISKNKNISLIDQINNYFVFLIIDQNQYTEKVADTRPVFNISERNDLQSVRVKEKDIIIGIKMKKMNELSIYDKEFVRNLIIIS